MKTAILLTIPAIALLSANLGIAQTPYLLTAITNRNLPATTPWAVVSRGPNSQIWERTVYHKGPSGRIIGTKHHVTEIATGLNHWVNNQWVPSSAEIGLLPDGTAAAVNGQHQVYFPVDIFSGTIREITPDGKVLTSQPLGISYDDGNQTILLAALTNSVGELVASNQVIYPNAFAGLDADLRYTVTVAGLEQDVILHQRPPDPQSLRLNPHTTKLQVLTEFFDVPATTVVAKQLPEEVGLTLSNVDLDFGVMKMPMGRAFLMGAEARAPGVPIAKEWLNVAGHRILVEEAPVLALTNELSQLIASVAKPLNRGKSGSTLLALSVERLPQGRHLAKAGNAKFTRAPLPTDDGLVWDYQTINGSLSDVTFQGDTTYYVSGPAYLSGTVTFEGGTVLKYFYGASVSCVGGATVRWLATPYHPVILTARDDATVGENIGTRLLSYYAGPALHTETMGSTILSNLCVRYAAVGLTAITVTVRDAQFVNCQVGISPAGSYDTWKLRNVLFANVQTGLDCQPVSIDVVDAENVTMDHCTVGVAGDPNATIVGFTATNCIFANIGSVGDEYVSYLGASHNGFYSSSPTFGDNMIQVSSNPFQTNGYGKYYLNSSSFRNSGTTADVDSSLLADLQTRTTQPPITLPVLMQVSGGLTLFPQVPRYTGGNPDLGYYYPALDYSLATMILAGGSVTVEPGTAIGVCNDYVASQNGWTTVGFAIEQGSSFTAHGTPTAPITFTSTKMVQEEPETTFTQFQTANNFSFSAVSFVPSFEPDALNSPPPTLDFRFCNFYLPGQDYQIWGGLDEYEDSFTFSPDSAVYLGISDCNLYGGMFELGKTYDESTVFGAGGVSLVNNLFDRVAINLDPNWVDSGDSTIYVDLALQVYNNLFHGGAWLHLDPFPASAGNWVFENNLFDQADFYQNASEPLDYDYNGYWPLTTLQGNGDTAELLPTTTGDGFTDGTDGNHEVILNSAPPYQTGPLGNYYLPNTTPLYGAGSETPAQAGLYHYTTRVDQGKEGNEPSGHMVNIGLHYVATTSSTSTIPLDTDGDGIPDYVEDANGNGVVDWNPAVNANETDPTLAKTDGSTPDAYNTAYDDIDLSGNGLVGRIEKALGLNPLDPSNPLTLTQIITGDEPQIVTFEVPVSYSLLTSIGNLELLVDGVTAQFQEFDQAGDGKCLLKWNTAFESPGQHELAAQLILNGETKKGDAPDPTVLDAFGPITPFYSVDICQFDPVFSSFDNSGATLYAKLPEQNATYTIELQATDGSHIKWLAVNQTTTSGEINVHWNLTYDDDVTVYTGGSAKAIFNVTLSDPSSGTLAYWLSEASTGPTGNTEYFTVAYAWNNSSQAQFGGSMFDCIMGSVVDRLMEVCNVNWCYNDPYSSSFDVWDTYPYSSGTPGYLQQYQPDVLPNLLNSLGDGNTMNFYFDGHGSTTEIGDGLTAPTSPVLGLGGVSGTLHNNGDVEGPQWKHPYRLVFLNACHTADNDHWAHAFGIPDRITTTELANGHREQAFLGWYLSPLSAQTDGDWDAMSETYAVFWDAWMSEQYTLQQCIQFASDPSLSFPFGKKYDINLRPLFWHYAFSENDFHLRIYGYAGIKRIGYDPDSSYDSSPYYQ